VTTKDPHGKLGMQALYRAALTESLFLGKYVEASKRFQQYADLAGDTPAAWDALKHVGEILYSTLQRYDQSATHYQAMLQRRPDATEAPELHFRVAKSRFYLWEFDEAVAAYRDIIRRYRKHPIAEQAAYEIGVTYFTRGEQRPNAAQGSSGKEAYQDAIDAFEDFIKQHPKSRLVAEARFGIANCLEELDQLDAAYHSYEFLKDTYPSPKVIAIKLARIKERKAQRSR
jgi:TolA-binding protein